MAKAWGLIELDFSEPDALKEAVRRLKLSFDIAYWVLAILLAI